MTHINNFKFNNFSDRIVQMRASFQKKRGKVISKRQELISSTLSQSKSSIRQPDLLFNKTNPRDGIRKAMEQVQVMLQEVKEAKEDLELKVSKLQMRGIEREKQFRRILQQAIPYCLKERSNNVLSLDLKNLHEKIIDFFELTQQEVQRNLLQDRHLLQGQMQRRIQQLTTHAQLQLEQHKRMQSLSYQAVHRQVTTALSHCTAVLNQNDSLKQKIRELTFNNSLLKQERALLIDQVLTKKNLILRMYSQLKEKYNRDDQIEKEIAVLKKQRMKVDLQIANYEQNQRKQIEKCFKNIQSIRPKAIQVFTTDLIKSKTPMKMTRSHSKNASAQQFSSTVQMKSKSLAKNILHKTIATNETTIEDTTMAQLKENLRRERKKCLKLTQKIEYLVAYKREVDLFIRECYRKGQLTGLNQEKIDNLLNSLKRVIEKEETPQQPIIPKPLDEDFQLILSQC